MKYIQLYLHIISTVVDRLIAAVTITFNKENPVATMRRPLLPRVATMGLCGERPVVFIRIHK